MGRHGNGATADAKYCRQLRHCNQIGSALAPKKYNTMNPLQGEVPEVPGYRQNNCNIFMGLSLIIHMKPWVRFASLRHPLDTKVKALPRTLINSDHSGTVTKTCNPTMVHVSIKLNLHEDISRPSTKTACKKHFIGNMCRLQKGPILTLNSAHLTNYSWLLPCGATKPTSLTTRPIKIIQQ